MRQTETGSKILGRSPKVTWDSVTGRPAPPVRNQCTFTPQLCCHLPCLTFFPARIPSAFLRRTSRYDPCSRWDASCPRLHACVVPCRGLAWLTHLCRQCERAREDPFWRTPGFGVFGRLHVRWYSNSVCKLSRFNGRMPRPAQPVLALQSVSVWAPTVPLTVHCSLREAWACPVSYCGVPALFAFDLLGSLPAHMSPWRTRYFGFPALNCLDLIAC